MERIFVNRWGDGESGRLVWMAEAPADVDVAAGDGFEPRHHPQQRGLAAAGGADQDAELTVADLEIDPLDGFDATGIGLVDVAQRDVSHLRPISPFRPARARTAVA